MGIADMAGLFHSMRLKMKLLILMAVALIGFLFIVITAHQVVNYVSAANGRLFPLTFEKDGEDGI